MSSHPPPVISEAPSDTAADPSLPPPQSPTPPAPTVTSPPPERQSESAAARRIIVIGCDETEAAKRSIAWCLDNVATTNDKIILMRAIPSTTSVFYPSVGLDPLQWVAMPTALEDLAIQHKCEAKAMDQMMASLVPALEEKKVPYEIDIIGAVGNDLDVAAVAHTIAQRAKEVKASLIIVSKHNKGFFKELFVGSVTSKLIAMSKVPVLVFQGDEAESTA